MAQFDCVRLPPAVAKLLIDQSPSCGLVEVEMRCRLFATLDKRVPRRARRRLRLRLQRCELGNEFELFALSLLRQPLPDRPLLAFALKPLGIGFASKRQISRLAPSLGCRVFRLG